MQWSGDRNAGFSRAKPQQLYLPAIIDAVYGHQVINVEAQADDPSSLLNWMRRMITVRRQHPAFGRGEMILLYPRNRKVLAYLREHEGRAYLCVANLADSAQAVELDLPRHRGTVPIELTGRSAFPPVGDLPYMLTLPAYGFYWFALSAEEETPSWHESLGDEEQGYLLPISARWGDENLRPGAPKLSYTLAKIRHTARVGALIDGAYDERLPQLLLDGLKEGRTDGDLRFEGTDTLRGIEDPGDPRQLGAEQSNLSIAFSDKIILKLYRRIREGEQPDVEVAKFLTEVAGYQHTPRYLGQVVHGSITLAAWNCTSTRLGPRLARRGRKPSAMTSRSASGRFWGSGRRNCTRLWRPIPTTRISRPRM